MLITERIILILSLTVIQWAPIYGSNEQVTDAENNDFREPTRALSIIKDDAEVLHGSSFELRRRKFVIGEFNITIKQNWRRLGLGCVVWPAAELLSMLVADVFNKSSLNIDVKDKFVVELGAGTGLPTIVAGLRGARIALATDRKEIIDKCTKSNILTRPEGLRGVYNVQGEILDWNGQSALKFIERYGKPDVIIGADLIYDESAFEPLVQTLQSLSDKNTQIVITGKERYKELNEKFISLLKAFNLEKYDILVLEDLVSDERDYVYILTRKEATCDD